MSLFPYLNSRDDPISRASSVFDGPSYDRNQDSQDTPDVQSSESHHTWHSAAEQTSPTLIVISGGSGCNAICAAFSQAHTCYALPVTDDGGSSSEIIRVIGELSIHGDGIMTDVELRIFRWTIYRRYTFSSYSTYSTRCGPSCRLYSKLTLASFPIQLV